MRKRVLSIILAVVMVLGAMPFAGVIAFAGSGLCEIDGTEYASISEALAEAENGDEIKLLANNSLGDYGQTGFNIAKGCDITIDLNGFIAMGTSMWSYQTDAQLKASGKSRSNQLFYVNSGATLTLKDSSEAQTGAIKIFTDPGWKYPGGEDYKGSWVDNLITNYGTVNIESGTYENNGSGSADYVIDNYGTGAFNITGGKLKALASVIRNFGWTGEGHVSGNPVFTSTYAACFQSMGAGKHDVYIDGGTFNAADYTVTTWEPDGAKYYFSHGTMTGYGVALYDGSEMVISGDAVVDGSYVYLLGGKCEISGNPSICPNSSYSVYALEGSKCDIKGGTFAGTAYIYCDADISGGTFNSKVYLEGDCNISGGTFNKNVVIYTGEYNISGGTFNGYLDSEDNNSCNITGGTFNSYIYFSKGDCKISGDTEFYDTYNAGGATFDITGGKCTTEPITASYTYWYNTDRDSYAFDENGNIVERTDSVCEINGTPYTSLAKAIAAAQEGDTIKMLADVDLVDFGNDGLKIPADKSVTLDLNGKALTGSGVYIIINNEGTLNIVDSSEDKSGEITADEDCYALANYGAGYGDDAVFNISGGTINGTIDATAKEFVLTGDTVVNGKVCVVAGKFVVSGNAQINAVPVETEEGDFVTEALDVIADEIEITDKAEVIGTIAAKAEVLSVGEEASIDEEAFDESCEFKKIEGNFENINVQNFITERTRIVYNEDSTVSFEPAPTFKVEAGASESTMGVSVTDDLSKSREFQLATVTLKADLVDKNGNWFVCWVDEDGKIVSTYTTYTFYVINNVKYTPKYVDPDIYAGVREEAAATQRISKFEYYANGDVAVVAERSISSGFFKSGVHKYGILLTTDDTVGASEEQFVDKEGTDDRIISRSGKKDGGKAYTGVAKTIINPNGADFVYARAFFNDGEKFYYSEIAKIPSKGEVTASSSEEILVLADEESAVAQLAGAEAIPEEAKDLVIETETEEKAAEDKVVEETAATDSTEESAKESKKSSILDIIKAIFKAIAEIFKKFVALF